MLLGRRVGGEGLVVRSPAPKPVPCGKEQAASHHLARAAPPLQPQGLSLAGLGVAGWVIDTDFEVLGASAGQDQQVIQPNTTCTGIVLVPSAEEEQQEPAAAGSRHPRRTLKVRGRAHWETMLYIGGFMVVGASPEMVEMGFPMGLLILVIFH